METFNNISPLTPVRPSQTRARKVPYRKPREDRSSTPSDQSTPEEQEDSNEGKLHIDEYA